MSKQKIILGIESSCDDTSAAVLQNDLLLSNLISSQDIHKKFGGVVPELASREHQKNIIPVVHEALKQAGVGLRDIDAIAFTSGPGLLGALLVGTSFAKGLSIALGKPLISVNHMQAHILAHFVRKRSEDKTPDFPFLCLTVSGGHTQIVLVKSHFDYKLIGETRDDAAGEAFDKIGKMLGLPYPAGPFIDKLAKSGNPLKFKFTLTSLKDYEYSFSGLKTNVLYFLKEEISKDENFVQNNLNDLCASVQYSIVEMLLRPFVKAAKNLNIKTIALAGGVAANSALRSEISKKAIEHSWELFIPEFEFCTDNAAMIGIAGYFNLLQNNFTALDVIPSARLTVGGNSYNSNKTQIRCTH